MSHVRPAKCNLKPIQPEITLNLSEKCHIVYLISGSFFSFFFFFFLLINSSLYSAFHEPYDMV